MGEVKRDMFPGYEIYEIIGSGGGGSVYRAYHKNLEKDVVIKKVHDRITDENQQKAEAYILKNLRHTYLPQVFDYITQDNCAYTVMDYIPGNSLGNYLKAGYRFTGKQVYQFALELCEVVAYLHSQNIPVIHGDIKPDNVMLTPDGHICLIDFNISGITQDGVAYSDGYTPGYSAPEQYYQYQEIVNRIQSGNTEGAELRIRIDKRSDVYSIAATIYHLYTGEKYVFGQSKELSSDTSDAFVYIINKALSANPDKRYKDAGEIFNALKYMHKSDRKYKGMLISQFFIRLFLILLLFLGGVLIFAGRNKSLQEKNDEYRAYIDELDELIEDGDEEEFSKVFDKAVKLYPEKLDAYYKQILFIYQYGDKEETLEYIDDVLVKYDFYSESNISNVYFIQGEAYLDLELYEEADNSFRTAIKYDGASPRFYTDDAIALARLGKLKKARNQLEEAENLGISDSLMYLVEGEIAFASEDYEKAKEYFIKCIDDTKEEYDLLRAYVMCSKTFEKMGGDEDTVNENLALIEEGLKKLPVNMMPMLLEQKANIAMAASQTYENAGYEYVAADALKGIIKCKFDSVITYRNLIIMYEKVDSYEEAKEALEDMLDKYPKDYMTYLRAARLECHYQNSILDDTCKDYTLFKEYYDKALELYEKGKVQSDGEMQVLTEEYERIVREGYL